MFYVILTMKVEVDLAPSVPKEERKMAKKVKNEMVVENVVVENEVVESNVPKEEKAVKKETKKKVTRKEVNQAVDAAIEAVVAEETANAAVEAVAEEEPKKKANRKKENVSPIKVLTNEELRALFIDNGCKPYSKADAVSVVYNTFGTKSRILQQQKAYQLLLTNGHKKVKDQVVECDNDDTWHFSVWFETLSDAEKGYVVGMDDIDKVKLSASEMPRERSVKITNFDLLVKFIQYMATFDINKPAVVTE